MHKKSGDHCENINCVSKPSMLVLSDETNHQCIINLGISVIRYENVDCSWIELWNGMVFEKGTVRVDATVVDVKREDTERFMSR